ncbi:MAG: hypothetical protein L3J15_08730 [Devosiaceae bacterium]|nr:hypothetical protein [Devosiaceae bacterium]
MNIPILIAAIISFLTIGLHVFGGGPEIMDPINDSELSAYLKAITFVIWHAVTTILLINSLALLHAALKEKYRKPIIIITSAQYLLWAGLFIFYGITRLNDLLPMPQWIIFSTIPVLAIIGFLRSRKTRKS